MFGRGGHFKISVGAPANDNPYFDKLGVYAAEVHSVLTSDPFAFLFSGKPHWSPRPLTFDHALPLEDVASISDDASAEPAPWTCADEFADRRARWGQSSEHLAQQVQIAAAALAGLSLLGSSDALAGAYQQSSAEEAPAADSETYPAIAETEAVTLSSDADSAHRAVNFLHELFEKISALPALAKMRDAFGDAFGVSGIQWPSWTQHAVSAPAPEVTDQPGDAETDAVVATEEATPGLVRTAGDGGEHLLGDSGDDTLTGGAGDDLLDGGAGADVMTGGAGNDIYVVESFGDRVIEAAAPGLDTVVVLTDSLNDFSLADLPDVENIAALGHHALHGQGNGADNVILGSSAADILEGMSGDDSLNGAAGDDVLDGGTGADVMRGGTGNDTYLVDNADDVVIEKADSGHDSVETTLEAYALADDIEDLAFHGTGSVVGIGNDGANQISGGDWDDWLYGDRVYDASFYANVAGLADTTAAEAGAVTSEQTAQDALSAILGYRTDLIIVPDAEPEADVTEVIGSKKNDTLVGSAGGDDIIYGGGGNDTIDGGHGADTLWGGSGHDTFVFRPGFGTDTIGDFDLSSSGSDKIYINVAGFTADDLDAAMVQVGSDVWINVTADDHIVLSNIDKMTLSTNDHFIF